MDNDDADGLVLVDHPPAQPGLPTQTTQIPPADTPSPTPIASPMNNNNNNETCQQPAIDGSQPGPSATVTITAPEDAALSIAPPSRSEERNGAAGPGAFRNNKDASDSVALSSGSEERKGGRGARGEYKKESPKGGAGAVGLQNDALHQPKVVPATPQSKAAITAPEPRAALPITPIAAAQPKGIAPVSIATPVALAPVAVALAPVAVALAPVAVALVAVAQARGVSPVSIAGTVAAAQAKGVAAVAAVAAVALGEGKRGEDEWQMRICAAPFVVDLARIAGLVQETQSQLAQVQLLRQERLELEFAHGLIPLGRRLCQLQDMPHRIDAALTRFTLLNREVAESIPSIILWLNRCLQLNAGDHVWVVDASHTTAEFAQLRRAKVDKVWLLPGNRGRLRLADGRILSYSADYRPTVRTGDLARLAFLPSPSGGATERLLLQAPFPNTTLFFSA